MADRCGPDGLPFPRIVGVDDDLGGRWVAGGDDPAMGVTVPTGRTMHPGDRITFTCRGHDPLGRELFWWLHPYHRPRSHPVTGATVTLTWVIHPASVGDRVYLGIGMAGRSRYHREGGPDVQGYDGWLVFTYRIVPEPTAALVTPRPPASRQTGLTRPGRHRHHR